MRKEVKYECSKNNPVVIKVINAFLLNLMGMPKEQKFEIQK
jgi:hypothetical protein